MQEFGRCGGGKWVRGSDCLFQGLRLAVFLDFVVFIEGGIVTLESVISDEFHSSCKCHLGVGVPGLRIPCVVSSPPDVGHILGGGVLSYGPRGVCCGLVTSVRGQWHGGISRFWVLCVVLHRREEVGDCVGGVFSGVLLGELKVGKKGPGS